MTRTLAICSSLFFLTALPCFAGWQAGVSRIDITPAKPVPLAGYGGATRLSGQVLHPIYLKALAVRDDGGDLSILVTADLVGLSKKMVEIITTRAKQEIGVQRERLILNYSHNHSCPVTGDVLFLYYDLTPAETAAVDRYTKQLYDKYLQVMRAAVGNLAPAELSFEQGLAGIAVNRRRARPGGRKLPGPVDQDVPVIAVRAADGRLHAAVFGYSCHTTALSASSVNGDYAGFAQLVLEQRYPGMTALFVQNCGGDANPLPRLMRSDDKAAVDLARRYGDILAESVAQVLSAKMRPVRGPLRAAIDETEIPFQRGPSRSELQKEVATAEGARKRQVQNLLRVYERDGKLPDRYSYPVQVWQFGTDLTFIALTGETVADYCLRFKKEYGWETTWVAGYNNDLLSYVPSLRVLREGDYEGTTGMAEYGHPAPYGYAIEEQIAQKVHELVEQTR
jgi:neutral ceramidase